MTPTYEHEAPGEVARLSLDGRHMKHVTIALLAASTAAFAQPSAATTRTLGPGTISLGGTIKADVIDVRPNTTIVVTGSSLALSAKTIKWGDHITFEAQGAAGDDGRSIPDSEQHVWCIAQDHNHWEEEWQNAIPQRGKRGGDGKRGGNGKDVSLNANTHVFASAAATITVHAGGGHGGAPGQGGKGESFSLKPSGADCDHGTNERQHKDGPHGDPGNAGAWGTNGHVTFRSRASVPKSRVVVDGGTLIWLAPP
jgi:hypothetical protein